MALAGDILILRDRLLADLTAAHDYHADTQAAWSIANDFFAADGHVTIRNLVTGTITTRAELAARARDYVAVQLPEATFQQFLSVFESFHFDFVRLWLTAHPRSLGKKRWTSRRFWTCRTRTPSLGWSSGRR